MRALVHLCCGPCGITVLQRLLDAGYTPEGFFFNPNIHPLAEYMRRREGAAAAAEKLRLPVIFADTFPLAEQAWPAGNPVAWLRAVHGNEDKRCSFCWELRIAETAAYAARRGYAAFTTSLLYSRYQDHERLRALCEEAATAHGVAFVYRDFRASWQEGIRLSKEWGIYRQQYCGCIYSEYERYARSFARLTVSKNGG